MVSEYLIDFVLFCFCLKPYNTYLCFCLLINKIIANQYRKVQWNKKQINLDEGRRLEAVCRADIDPSTLRLDVTRRNGQQRESIPLGLSFSNGYLSLSAVTKQDNELEFICSSGDSSDILILYVQPTSNAFAN
jgi:hypothetical protein